MSQNDSTIANLKSQTGAEEATTRLTSPKSARDLANPLHPSPGPYTGPDLTSWQYEALCRHALSRTYGIPIQAIQTGYLESPTKTPKKIRHQIDLYWTSHDGVCDFLVIANAKFRKENVTLTQLMTLLGVQHDLHAHKAMMITNTGYSPTVLLQAKEKGIALLIVRPFPDIDFSSLPKSTAPAIAGELEKIASTITPLYRLHVVHRGFDRPRPPRPQSAFSNPQSAIHMPPPTLRPEPNRRANKMVRSSPPTARAPFGIRRK